MTMNKEMEEPPAPSMCNYRRRNYFGKFRFVLKIIGLSIEENISVAYKIYSFLVIFTGAFLYSLIRVVTLFKYDKETFVNTLMFPYGTTLAFAKSMVFLWNRNRLAKLLDKLEQEPFLPDPNRGNESDDEKLTNNCLRIIQIQTVFYTGMTMLFVTLSTIYAMTRRIISNDYHNWQLPFSPVTLLNVTHSPNYEIWWLYEHYSIYICGLHFTIVDSIVAAVLTHVTFQFKILQNNVRSIVEISQRELMKDIGHDQGSSDLFAVDASIIPWKYLKRSLSQAVNYHLAIISVANEMEELFNRFQLFVFLNALGLMGVVVGQTTPMAKEGILVVGCQLLASCFWGQQVLYESQEVGQAAFEANFVGGDLRFQKSLLLIIRRSQNPIVLTAGKFAVVSLPTFTWVMRAAYSASTVLQQVK